MYNYEKTLVHEYRFKTELFGKPIAVETDLKGVKAFLFGDGDDDERQIWYNYKSLVPYLSDRKELMYFSNGKRNMVNYLKLKTLSNSEIRFWNHIVNISDHIPAIIIKDHIIKTEKHGELYVTAFTLFALGNSKYGIMYETCKYEKGEFEKKDNYMYLPIVITWKERIKNFINI